MTYSEHFSLKELTTIGIGGIAEHFYLPESKSELIDLLIRFKAQPHYLLGNGSNLLISGGSIKAPVIGLKLALRHHAIDDAGDVTVGSSVDIRKLIDLCANRGLRSPVELLTVPATVGGAIYMNAGRTSLGIDISQSLVEVEVFDGEKCRCLKKQECDFGHRRSLFQEQKNLVILGARFHFPPVSKEQIMADRKSSLQKGADKCYKTNKSAGSVFKVFDDKIIKSLMGIKLGGAMYAPRTPNCILNMGEATFLQVLWLVRLAQILHKIRRRPCKLEWEIWR